MKPRFTEERDKCHNIKKLIEKLSRIENIGLKSRKRHLSDARKIYSKLCKIFTKSSLEEIGEVLGINEHNYSHATILHNIKKFEHLHDVNQLSNIHIYNKAFKYIQEHEDLIKKIVHQISFFKTQQDYRIKAFDISQKTHSIINRQRTEIEELKTELEYFENKDYH